MNPGCTEIENSKEVNSGLEFTLFLPACTVSGYIIDKLYTQMSKVFHLPWELNLLLSCFGLLALYSRICCNRWPSLPAWHPSTVVLARHSTAVKWKVRFNLREEASPPSLFPSSCIILFIYGVHIQYTYFIYYYFFKESKFTHI